MTLEFDTFSHHPVIEEIVSVLCRKTQNTDTSFFKIEAAYFLGKMAASMRVNLMTKDRGEIPANIYALALATSGSGKGYSVHILEESFLSKFKTRFMTETFPQISDQNLWTLAMSRAVMNGGDENKEKEKLDINFRDAGNLAFTFDSGTTAAVKQMREKLLMAKIGAINLQIDEIGSNLIGSTDILNTFLELYDQGIVKIKLTKNTKENQRLQEIDGKTPTNMLLFGTPAKLLDGGQTEDSFYSFLETGYARRCLFAIGQKNKNPLNLNATEVYQRLIDQSNDYIIDKLSTHFATLADPMYYNWRVNVSDASAIYIIEYKLHCERISNSLPDHEEILKSEISHRFAKMMKLAGVYAFIDMSFELELHHIQQAMKLVEESGQAFQSILRRDKSYARLARYLVDVRTPQTHADLNEALPFYKSSHTARTEQLVLAKAWGYNNHIIIKTHIQDGIEFFSGETLKKTDLENIILSYSSHVAYNYVNDVAPFKELEKLFLVKDYHWANHHFEDGHRHDDKTIPEFNLLVLDVDDKTPLSLAQELLKKYTYSMYTTKRHVPGHDRFRIILPMNFHLSFDIDTYREFMENFANWLPFNIDRQANQRSRKWLTNDKAIVFHNEGDLLDILPFIPKTSRNDQYVKEYQTVANLGNLERWFLSQIASGNRNNHLARYAFALIDLGLDYKSIENSVILLNSKTVSPISDLEIRSTILKSVANRMQKNNTP